MPKKWPPRSVNYRGPGNQLVGVDRVAHYSRTATGTSPVRLSTEFHTDECLHRNCEKQVPEHYGFQLCERHLAKAWAAFEVLHGQTEETIRDQKSPIVMHRGVERRRGIVYFAEAHGMLKIGWTQNLKQRVKSLNAKSVIWYTNGTRGDEAQYLKMFSEHLTQGNEWFALNGETRKMVDSLKSAA